jgi:calcineurin-like phosphoesterase family protein
MIYFTSDWHFSHYNVINYCKRPFTDVHEMNKSLTSLWNDTIKPEDTVYFLGDFAMNKNVVKVILPMLNGRKILIPGNHDACFKFPCKVPNDPRCVKDTALRDARMERLYKEAGFEAIHQTLLLQLKDGTTVLMSHLPYGSPDGNKYDRRYEALKPKDEGLVLLHGHLHGHYRKLGRMIDVGIDGGMEIFSEDDIIELIKDPREYIPTSISQHYEDRDHGKVTVD